MKKIIALFGLLVTYTTLQAQLPANAWAKSFAGTSSMVGTGRAVVVDASGNVYSTGSFQGTVDFDPGIATYTLASNGNEDVFVTKLDASGNFVWAKTLGGGAVDRGYGVALDASGNVIVCGYFIGSNVDFDPGAGTALKSSGGSSDADVFGWKLTPAGNYVTAYTFGGSSDDVALAVATDATGNIYLTGFVNATVDLDPTAGVSTYTSTGLSDIFIVKMGPSNNFLWGKGFGGTGNDAANAIALDGTSAVVITGYYESTADFDPTASTLNLTSTGYQDAFIARYNSSGAVNWAQTIGGTTGNDIGTGVALDPGGNIYAVGNFLGTVDIDPTAAVVNATSSGSTDFYIVKLLPVGNTFWAKSIGGPYPDYAYGLTVDSYGDAYICGNYSNTVDFDPDAGVANISVNGNTDFFIDKINSSGNYSWAKGIGGSLTEIAYAITVDASKNLYTTGNFNAFTDFDPNVLSYTLTTAASTTDAFVQKMGLCPTVNAAITGTNVLCYGGSTGGMQASASGGTLFTYSWTPSIGTAALQPNRPAGNYTCVVTNDCYNTASATFTITQPLPLTNINSGNVTLCQGLSTSLFITPSGGMPPYTYTWTPGATLTSTNTANTSASPGTSTNYNYTVRDNNTCSTAGSLSVTVNTLPPVVVSPTTTAICAGSSSTLTATGAITYSWSSGALTSSITVSPVGTTIYTVTGTGANGCAAVKTTTVTVNPLPVASAIAPTNLCIGGNLTFTNTSTGASTYSWAGPSLYSSTLMNPTITNLTSGNAGTYTLSALSAAGCLKTTTLAVTVNALPSLTLTPSATSVCAGNTVAITATGATTYTWMPGSLIGSAQTFTPVSTTVYTASGTNAAGCVGTKSLAITVNALPPVVLSPTTSTICAGSSSTLTATGATTYSWSSGPITSSITVSPASTTIYTVTGTGANGCYVIKTATVTVNANPVALAAVNSTVCYGANITFTNTSTGAGSYSWSGPSSYASTASAPVITNATNAQTGTYTLTALNAATTCSASTTVSLSVNTMPTINTSIAGSPACAGSTVTVGASGVGINTYTWNPGALVGAMQTYTVTSGMTFTVSGTNVAGCIGTTTLNVIVNPLTAISGTVTNSSNPVAGTAILYGYEPFFTRFDSITTQTLNGSGAYSFTSVPAGNYIVKAVPSANTLQVTYGSNAISWQNASVIIHGCVTNTTQNIAVVALSNIGTGPGSLSGTITEGHGFGQRPSSVYSPLAPGSPIGGIVVKGGKNPGGNMFVQTTTSSLGTYTLAGLPANSAGESYFILVDIPGLDTNNTYHKIITLSNNQYTGLDFVVDSVMINPIPSATTGIKTMSNVLNQIQLYPNPAKNKVSIQYSLQSTCLVSIEIIDLVGQTVKTVLPVIEQSADNYKITALLEELKAGMYFVKVKINHSESTLRFMITD